MNKIFYAITATIILLAVIMPSVEGAGKGQRSDLKAIWTGDVSDGKIHFSDANTFVDIIPQQAHPHANGDAILIDTTGYTEARIQVTWDRDAGSGNHMCWVIQHNDYHYNLLIIGDLNPNDGGSTLHNGSNDSTWQKIPSNVVNQEMNFKIQCASSVASDTPLLEQAVLWLR